MTDPTQELRARLVADRVTTTHAQDAANKATPGPWEAQEDDWSGYAVVMADDMPGDVIVAQQMIQGHDEGESDAAFIAWSREGVPALVALVDARDAAIQAVLNLHAPNEHCLHEDGISCCLDCEHMYPCPTVAAVVSALDGNGQNT